MPLPQALGQLRGAPELLRDRQRREHLVQLLREPPQRRRRGAADPEGGDLLGIGLHVLREVLRGLQQHPGVIHGPAPHLVEHDAVPAAVKERDPQLRLQPLHGAAQHGLGDMQLLRGGGERPAVRDGDKLLDLLQFQHSRSPPFFPAL